MPTDKKFRVTLITVKNIMGAEHAELRPGALTLIEGKNGLGKTTLIEAAKLPFAKGHKATLLREGCDEGEVVVVLDDGEGTPLLVSATVDKEGTKRTIGYAGQAPMGRPAETIGKLRNEFTLFPTSFLTMKKEDRLEMFLSAIPLKVEKSDLAGILALSPDLKKIDVNRHAFKVLSEIEDVLYKKRTGVNAIVTNNRKTAATMKAALPVEALDGEAATKELASLNEQLEAFREEVRIAVGNIRQRYNDTVEEARAIFDAAVKDATDVRDKAIEGCNSAANAGIEGFTSNIAKVKADANTFIRMEETRKQIARFLEEANVNEKESKALTEAIDVDLAELRSALLDQVPIKGVTVSDGDIFVATPAGQPIPFDSVNTKERIRVACDLALLHAGPLPLLLMDGAEALDDESLDALRDDLEARGAQCLASRVTQSKTLETRTA